MLLCLRVPQAPAFDWIYKVLTRQPSKEIFQTVLVQYRDMSNEAPLLRLIIDNFSPSFYASNSLAMVALIKMATDATLQEVKAGRLLLFLVHPNSSDPCSFTSSLSSLTPFPAFRCP